VRQVVSAPERDQEPDETRCDNNIAYFHGHRLYNGCRKYCRSDHEVAK
jgi:hypothetical protein